MIWTSLIAQGKRQVLMSILLAVLLSAVYLAVARFYRTSVEGWILGVGWVLVLGNLLRALLGALYRWDRQPFRRFDLGLHDDRVRVGQAFRVELVLQARRTFELAHLAVDLRCFDERVTERGREQSVLHERRHVVSEGMAVSADGDHRFQVELAVPSGAPSSFKDPGGRIRWSLSIDAEVVGWGTLRDEFGVTVAPS